MSLEENTMRTKSPPAAFAGFTSKVVQKTSNAGQPPSMETVKARLSRLTHASMPWLSKDADLTPPDGGPEVVGPSVYPGPKQD